MGRLTYVKHPRSWGRGKHPTKYTSRHTFQEVVARLAAYEDAMPLERAQELAQAEKDGRLVVLPCKPGTPIWEIGDFDGGNLKKRPFSVEDMSFWRFGTTVFLTREEAEAALKKREADNEAD